MSEERSIAMTAACCKSTVSMGWGSTIASNNCSRQLAVEVTRVSSKDVLPGQQGSASGTSTGTSGPEEVCNNCHQSLDREAFACDFCSFSSAEPTGLTTQSGDQSSSSGAMAAVSQKRSRG